MQPWGTSKAPSHKALRTSCQRREGFFSSASLAQRQLFFFIVVVCFQEKWALEHLDCLELSNNHPSRWKGKFSRISVHCWIHCIFNASHFCQFSCRLIGRHTLSTCRQNSLKGPSKTLRAAVASPHFMDTVSLRICWLPLSSSQRERQDFTTP